MAFPRLPARPASSEVLTRFPLWPRASPREPLVLNEGWALSHVVDPVVE